MAETVTILIMDDGETWGGVEFASLCTISKEEYMALCDGLITCGDLKPMLELVLRDYTIKETDNG